MNSAIRVEWLKMSRSRVTLVATILMGVLLPAMGLGFFTVAHSGGTGAMAVKAAAMLAGEGWVGYLGLIDQIAAVAVFIGAGVVVAWVFGREHADRTFQSLFSLSVSRGSVALAKFVVLEAWVIALALLITSSSVMLGLGAGVGSDIVASGVVGAALRLLAICVAGGSLALTVGYVASVGRGYLPAIGALIVIVAVAQVAVLFGTGGWFPFAVPGLAAVSGTPGIPELTTVQLGLVPALVLAVVPLTVRWWRNAEVV